MSHTHKNKKETNYVSLLFIFYKTRWHNFTLDLLIIPAFLFSLWLENIPRFMPSMHPVTSRPQPLLLFYFKLMTLNCLPLWVTLFPIWWALCAGERVDSWLCKPPMASSGNQLLTSNSLLLRVSQFSSSSNSHVNRPSDPELKSFLSKAWVTVRQSVCTCVNLILLEYILRWGDVPFLQERKVGLWYCFKPRGLLT